jgi:two-component system response regulator LytT
MKVKLICDQDKYEEYKKILTSKGFEIDDNATIVFEDLERTDHFIGKIDNTLSAIKYDDIIYIESYGHNVYLVTSDGRYQIKERLYEAFEKVEKGDFIKISISVIINPKHIKKIKATYNQKFHLTMKNGDVVDVTRSYYNDFKDKLGI